MEIQRSIPALDQWIRSHPPAVLTFLENVEIYRPRPETPSTLEPPVELEKTRTLPLYFFFAGGENFTFIFLLLPGAMVPDHFPLNPLGYFIRFTFKGLFPKFQMVNWRVVFEPTGLCRNCRLPVRLMIRVGAAGGGGNGTFNAARMPGSCNTQF